MTKKPQRRDEDGYQRFLGYLGEAGIEPELRGICLTHAVTLRDIYLDVRGPSCMAARLEVWWWLSFKYHKSRPEIARLFDRDPGSIAHAFTRLRDTAAANGRETIPSSYIHGLSVLVATSATIAWTESGRRVAPLGVEARKKKLDGES